MNCTNCGSILKENFKFCRQCGEQVQEGLETSPVVQPLNVQSSESISVAASKEWLRSFIEFVKALLKNPLMSPEEMNHYINRSRLFIYMFAIIAISSILRLFTVKIIANKIISVLQQLPYFISNIIGYGVGSSIPVGDILEIFDKDVSIKFIFSSILYSSLLIAIITGVTILIYKVIMKYDLKWEDCIKLMIMPLLILACGNLLLMVVSLISLKYAVFLYFIILFMFGVLTIIQFINKLKNHPRIIYTMPAIYLICVTIQIYLTFKFMS